MLTRWISWAILRITQRIKGDNMKSVTIETLSGKIFHIDNVGDCFLVAIADKDYHFSSLAKAIEFVRSNA